MSAERVPFLISIPASGNENRNLFLLSVKFFTPESLSAVRQWRNLNVRLLLSAGHVFAVELEAVPMPEVCADCCGCQGRDLVITVPNTFIATTEAITQLVPRRYIVDVDPQTSNISVPLLREYLERTVSG
jgi:hypothetical protein